MKNCPIMRVIACAAEVELITDDEESAAILELSALRAKLAEAERDRDLAERKAAVYREDVEISAKRAEAAEARAKALEAAAGEWLDHSLCYCSSESARCAIEDRLRALLAPAEPKPFDVGGTVTFKPEPCATCGGFNRVCRCHGEPPHRDCIDLIPCPMCWKDGGS